MARASMLGGSSKLQRNRHAVAFVANINRNANFPVAAHVKAHALNLVVTVLKCCGYLRFRWQPMIVFRHPALDRDHGISDCITGAVFDMQRPAVNLIDCQRLKFADVAHRKVTGIGFPGLVILCIRIWCEEGAGEYSHEYIGCLTYTTTHEPVVQLQDQHSAEDPRPVSDSGIADLERKYGSVEFLGIHLPRGHDPDVFAVFLERLQHGEYVGDYRWRFVADGDCLKIVDSLDMFNSCESAFAGHIPDDPKIDLSRTQAIVLVFHNKDAVATYGYVFAVLFMLAFFGNIYFEMCPEVANIDHAEVVLLDHATVSEGRSGARAQEDDAGYGDQPTEGRKSHGAILAKPRWRRYGF
jgi:hypothetical protein